MAIQAPQAISLAADDVKNLRVARVNIEMWHGTLFNGFPPVPYYAGNIRQPSDDKPCLEMPIHVRGRPGSDWRDVPRDMDRLCRDLRKQLKQSPKWADLEPVERLSKIASLVCRSVGRFIQIHPFLNGNGRISRLLWMVVLRQFGFEWENTVLKHPDPPYDDVMASCMTGDFDPLFDHVLLAIAQQPTSDSEETAPSS